MRAGLAKRDAGADPAWARSAFGGAALGAVLILVVAGLIALCGGVRFGLDALAVWLMWRWRGSANVRPAMLAPLG